MMTNAIIVITTNAGTNTVSAKRMISAIGWFMGLKKKLHPEPRIGKTNDLRIITFFNVGKSRPTPVQLFSLF
jgi:hypothetical protein